MYNFDPSVVGCVVAGMYKRADRDAHPQAVEVTALVLLRDGSGRRHLYLFGTSLNGYNAGDVVLMRADCFRESTVTVTKADDFVKIDGYAEKQWYYTPGHAAFAVVERVQDADTQAWAVELGGVEISAHEVKAA